MKTEIFTCYETNLTTGEKKEVNLKIKPKLSDTHNGNKEEGDIWEDCGTIRYVFNIVPECLYNNRSLEQNATCLSLK